MISFRSRVLTGPQRPTPCTQQTHGLDLKTNKDRFFNLSSHTACASPGQAATGEQGHLFSVSLLSLCWVPRPEISIQGRRSLGPWTQESPGMSLSLP